jgi:hypothetical protein
MPWVDGNNGAWKWTPEGTEPTEAQPTAPPPSARMGSGYSGSDDQYTQGYGRAGETHREQTVSVPSAPPPPPAPSTNANVDGREGELLDYVRSARDERRVATDDLVNRYSAIQLDTGPADQARQAQERAIGLQQNIYDKLMSYDPRAEANAASQRATARAMTMARSGGGGAAARQAAQFQALQQSPAIQAEAAAQANAQAQRNTQLAAGAASSIADIAQGTRGQDIDQAQAVVNTGLNVANGIANAVGRDLQLTSDEAKFLGQMQIALERLNVDWASLDETQRANIANEALRAEGLEQEWKMFQKSQEIGVLDVLGAVTGTARAGVSTYAQGKQAGLWG